MVVAVDVLHNNKGHEKVAMSCTSYELHFQTFTLVWLKNLPFQEKRIVMYVRELARKKITHQIIVPLAMALVSNVSLRFKRGSGIGFILVRTMQIGPGMIQQVQGQVWLQMKTRYFYDGARESALICNQ